MILFFNILNSCFLIIYNLFVIATLLGFDKKDYRKNHIQLFAFGAFVNLISILAIITLGFNTFILLELLLIQLPLYVFFWYISPYRGLKLLFVILTGWIWYMPIMSFGNIVSSAFSYDILVKCIAQFVCAPIMLLLIRRYFTPIYKYMLEHLDKGWGLFCLIPIICAFITYTSSYFALKLGLPVFYESMVWRYLVYGLMFLIYLLMIMSFLQIKKQFSIRNELDLYKMQLDGASDYIQSLRTSLQMNSIHQHDLRHHLQFIRLKASTSDSDSILKYVDKIQENIDTSHPTVFCKNETLNLILTAFQKKAEAEGIRLTIKGHLPESIHIPDGDLCVLLSNALENAIRSTKALPYTKRQISLSMHKKNEQLFLEISNPYLGEIKFKDGVPVSTRDGGGIGTRSIIYIVEKYGGIYSFTTHNGEFSLQIVI